MKINKRSKVCMRYLYTQVKYKSITVYTKAKEGGGAYIIASKKRFSLNMFLRNKQNKLRQTKKDEIKVIQIIQL